MRRRAPKANRSEFIRQRADELCGDAAVDEAVRCLWSYPFIWRYRAGGVERLRARFAEALPRVEDVELREAIGAEFARQVAEAEAEAAREAREQERAGRHRNVVPFPAHRTDGITNG